MAGARLSIKCGPPLIPQSRREDCYFQRFARFSKQIFRPVVVATALWAVFAFKKISQPMGSALGTAHRAVATTMSLRTPLARKDRAHLIEGMFGVTTTDDYQPVTWVGRHPVH